MQRKTRKIIGAVALIGALAAGGAAFTAGYPLADQTQSYSSAHITGADASTLSFRYSPDGSFVTGATVTLKGNESSVGSGVTGLTPPNASPGADAPYTITAGFTGTGPLDGSTPPVALGGLPTDDRGSTCGTGNAASSAVWTGLGAQVPPAVADTTVVTCDFTQSGSGTTGWSSGNGYYTQQTLQFNLLVSGADQSLKTGTP